MKKILLRAMSVITFIVPFTILLNAQPQYEEQLPPEQLRADLQILKRNLERVHPGLYTYHPKTRLDSLFEAIEQQIGQGLSPVSFYRKLLPLLPLIANNHTKIECPQTYEDALVSTLPRFPFSLYHRFGKLYVFEDASSEQIIGEGSEIVSINGMETKTIISRMLSLLSTDGYNTSFPFLWIGRAFSRTYAYHFGTPDLFTIEYLDRLGRLQSTTIKGITVSEIDQHREVPPFMASQKAIFFQVKGEIGYLKINSFQPESPSSFRKTISDAFRTLKSENLEDLIIDVRGNGGGYGEATGEVLRYLIKSTIYPYRDEYALTDEVPDPAYYVKDMFLKHFKRQKLIKDGDLYHVKNITKQRIKPNSNYFDGRLYILIDARSASATGDFLGQVKTHTDAVFIGEESGGNPCEATANDLLHMVLPHTKVRVTIPALRTIMNVNFKNTGHGIQPDVEIIPTIEEVLNNQDPVLDSVLLMVTKH